MGSLMRRPTIMDIARAAGVSKGAVSYALNGRPGVSDETRQRILDIARDFGWAPSVSAQALSPGGKTRTIGLVTSLPAHLCGDASFFLRMVSGFQAQLAASGMELLVEFVPDAAAEIASYRRWAAELRVDGVLMGDVRVEDARIAAVEELSLPAVVLGGPDGVGSLPHLPMDDVSSMHQVVHYLVALGHRRLARVAGPEELVHTRVRTRAFEEITGSLGTEEARTVHADYSGDGGARATRRLLSDVRRPTAVLYDNDLMAVAGLGVAAEMAIRVPAELSIVSWEDSPLCRAVWPALTAVDRDTVDYGRQAALTLIRAIEKEEAVTTAPFSQAELHPRASTGPWRHRTPVPSPRPR